jgi:hypothetical protein
MTQALGMQYFLQGISKLKQWTGCESKEVEKQILPAIIGVVCPKLYVSIAHFKDDRRRYCLDDGSAG